MYVNDGIQMYFFILFISKIKKEDKTVVSNKSSN